ILGAGAAGLMCAIEAGKRGKRILVLDHADSIGKKILISGGGRCNFTNIHCKPENFLSANPHFAKSALARYTPQDILALTQKHGIPSHEKTLGQLFCDRSARDIVTMLEKECAEAGVSIQPGTRITGVSHADGVFTITAENESFTATSLVIATGGLSIPKMGATAFGYEIAKQFGHKLVPTRPALVPLTFAPADQSWSDLSGISLEVIAQISDKKKSFVNAGATAPKFREKLLITHRGLSGPAVLQISSYWKPGTALTFDLAPGRNVMSPVVQNISERSFAALREALYWPFPQRFADRWIKLHTPADWKNPALAAYEAQLHDWRITPAGTEGYDKAEVTAGGIDTDGLSSATMESKHQKNLYFIGEVVDVTGWLGGFNFQWAWASGAAAGRAL
ncbi:MAG TPA: NAD(P)/FAD-dependent oxidoreductase, partial [Acidobacteriaceae bacterium]|nr:NAD(P)/FAD-dependent oxidoreductase [Acidobacteriaceae bacterium]